MSTISVPASTATEDKNVPTLIEAIKELKPNDLIEFLRREKDLQLDEDDFQVFRNEKITGGDFLIITENRLLSYGIKGGPAMRISNFVKKRNPAFSEKRNRNYYTTDAIGTSPKKEKISANSATTFKTGPNVQYPPSRNTTSVDSKLPKEVLLWEDFLEKANEHLFDQQQMVFEKPQFHYNRLLFNESNVCEAVNANINSVLNELMGTDYEFSSRKPYVGEPDFTCYHNNDLVMIFEVKRKHILKEMDERTLPELYITNDKAKMVIRQIYGYMVKNQLQYGIITTYDGHWFLYRSNDHPEVLYISKTLPLQSKAPPKIIFQRNTQNPFQKNTNLIMQYEIYLQVLLLYWGLRLDDLGLDITGLDGVELGGAGLDGAGLDGAGLDGVELGVLG
ncbi:6726_t:CDS:2 [Dentiscutata heterogama]|uniref:6726_t:CDS:1 n=1 Tax=Dentiscutata heterogama TaxID=1316150 RepID=A0ACA9M6E6_9GLOM|nr:6726_t:CDS:2 [Dentiscutata heterogama]